ncbi:MAG TPA: hypothetical protein VII92_02285 [Anaerolineae bacterium]
MAASFSRSSSMTNPSPDLREWSADIRQRLTNETAVNSDHQNLMAEAACLLVAMDRQIQRPQVEAESVDTKELQRLLDKYAGEAGPDISECVERIIAARVAAAHAAGSIEGYRNAEFALAASQAAPVKAEGWERRKFFDLALGARFKYLEGDQEYVLLERFECGRVAHFMPSGVASSGQGIYSAFDSEDECRSADVLFADPSTQPGEPQ